MKINTIGNILLIQNINEIKCEIVEVALILCFKVIKIMTANKCNELINLTGIGRMLSDW